MRQFVTSNINDINIGDVVYWFDGIGKECTATVLGIKLGASAGIQKVIRLFSGNHTPVQHMINLHRVLKVVGGK